MSEYKFKRLDDNNLADLKSLVKRCFNLDVSEDFLKKKYDTENFGAKYVGYIAYDDADSPAAYYGVFPIKCRFQDKVVLAAQSGDTMTDPNHQKKGLFTRLASMTYELAQQERIQFVFGFPNKNSYPGLVRKLNWQHNENMRVYTINLPAIPLAETANRLSFLKSWFNEYAASILGRFGTKTTNLPNSVLSRKSAGVERDETFFNYKKYSLNKVIQLNGFTVWVKVGTALFVGDVVPFEESEMPNLTRSLRRLARALGCYKIIFSTSPATFLDEVLSKYYEPVEGLAIGYLDLGSKLPIDKMKYVMGDYDTF